MSRLKIALVTVGLLTALVTTFAAGCVIGFNTPPRANLGIGAVSDAWHIIYQSYVDRSKLDAAELSEGAIRGLLEVLDDPHSSYLSAEDYRLGISNISGKFEGIGAFVGMKDGQIVIIAPIPNSPAAKAGIKPGDILLTVDGKSAAEMGLEGTILYTRGPKGTAVKLLIQHAGETRPVEIEVVRAEIEVASVQLEMKQDIAYIWINHFYERTDQELAAVLEQLAARAATGIVLDLRSNPGGLLDSVIDVASHFIKKGDEIVSIVDNNGKEERLVVEKNTIKTDLPMVVLTDNFSASASEVLTGALQDYGRATVAGTKTYGKGSVNNLYRLRDGAGLYLTTARWYTPQGRLIEGVGLTPDFELELEGEALVDWAVAYLKGKRS